MSTGRSFAQPTSAAQIGNYEVVREIGRGGMGVVFEGRHVALGKRVAIKRMAAVASPMSLKEARAAARFQHPNVVDVIDVGEQDGVAHVIMELLEGEELATKLKREAPLAFDDALNLLLPVAAGIASGHAAGVVHRDLKPSNIFLARGSDGFVVPKIVDFGIAKILERDPSDPTRTQSEGLLGTVEYMPPEQIRNPRAVTAASDQYALGVILYECVTGGTPYWGADRYDLLHDIMSAALVPPTRLNPELPSGIDDIVARALARDPRQRFSSVAGFAAALVELRASLSSSSAVSGPTPERPHSAIKKRSRWFIGAGCALFLVGAAARMRGAGPAAAASRLSGAGLDDGVASGLELTKPAADACTNTLSDPLNCGRCGHRCVGDPRCLSGTCANAPLAVSSSNFGYTTCALLAGGTVFCWGANDWGQVGTDLAAGPCIDHAVIVNRDVEGRQFDDVAAISLDHNHTCALKGDGTVFCWGRDDRGQLGDRLAGPNVLHPQRVPTELRFDAIALGGDRTCGINREKRVWCWGANSNDVLGHVGGTLGDRRSGPNEPWSNSAPRQVPGLRGVLTLSVGLDHACAVDKDGLACWGSNESGQLGDELVAPAGEITIHRPGVAATGVVSGLDLSCAWGLPARAARCWGGAARGPIAQALTGAHGESQTRQVAAGSRAIYRLDADGSLWSAGYNLDGELGSGTRGGSDYCEGDHALACINSFNRVVDVGGGLSVRSVTAGYRHGCAIGVDDAVYCWGTGACGVLGDAKGSGSVVAVRVVGLPEVAREGD